MNEIFLGFVNRAVTAGWLVLAVLVLRLLLRRAPRRFHCRKPTLDPWLEK